MKKSNDSNIVIVSAMVIAGLVVLFLVGASAYFVARGESSAAMQRGNDVNADADIAISREDRMQRDLQTVMTALRRKESSGGSIVASDRSSPLSKEITDAILRLKRDGGQIERLAAAVAEGDERTALSLLDSLKAIPELPDDTLFLMYTLKGDRLYIMGEYDDAITPYEKATRLRPDDSGAITNLAVSLSSARLRNIAENQERAIALLHSSLSGMEIGSVDWALTQGNLGRAWQLLPTGDIAANLTQAIQCYESSLEVFTRDAYPEDWARTQNNLGAVWEFLPVGDVGANIGKAIACYEAALEVRTLEAYPEEWAITQNNLGIALRNLPSGDRVSNLTEAITRFESALQVFDRVAYPLDWAMTKNNLGNAWLDMPAGDRSTNLANAIKCYEKALEVRTYETQPTEWATTQNNLGNAWQQLPSDDPQANLAKAISCYESALKVLTPETHPLDFAMTQSNLGSSLLNHTSGDRAANIARAARAFRGALLILTSEAFPYHFEVVWNKIALCREVYVSEGHGTGAEFDALLAGE